MIALTWCWTEERLTADLWLMSCTSRFIEDVYATSWANISFWICKFLDVIVTEMEWDVLTQAQFIGKFVHISTVQSFEIKQPYCKNSKTNILYSSLIKCIHGICVHTNIYHNQATQTCAHRHTHAHRYRHGHKDNAC